MLAVSLAARGLWVTAGTWCSKRLCDVVPDPVLASFGSTRELEAELRSQGIWKRVRNGYRFTQPGLCKIPEKTTFEHKRELATARQGRWRAGRRRESADAPDAVDNSAASGKPVDAPVDAPDRLQVDAVDNSAATRTPQKSRSSGRRRHPVDAPVDASTPASPLDLDLGTPDPSSGTEVNRSNGHHTRARASPDLIDLIIKEVHAVTGHYLSDEWAQRTYVTILGGRHPASPAAYIRQAIRNESDPKTRFLPLY